MKTQTKTMLDDSDMQTVANGLRVAAERYRENAKEFRKMSDAPAPPPDAFWQIHGEAARRLEEQFERQAEEAQRLADLFGSAERVTVEGDD